MAWDETDSARGLEGLGWAGPNTMIVTHDCTNHFSYFSFFFIFFIFPFPFSLPARRRGHGLDILTIHGLCIGDFFFFFAWTGFTVPPLPSFENIYSSDTLISKRLG